MFFYFLNKLIFHPITLNYSKQALELRIKLWDGILIYLEYKKSLIPVE
jgi:hypothetical protein